MFKKDKNEPFSRSKMKYADKIKYGQCKKFKSVNFADTPKFVFKMMKTVNGVLREKIVKISTKTVIGHLNEYWLKDYGNYVVHPYP